MWHYHIECARVRICIHAASSLGLDQSCTFQKKKKRFDQRDAKNHPHTQKNLMHIPARSLQRAVAEASNLRDELAKTVMDAVGRLAKMHNTSVFDRPRCLYCAGKEWGCERALSTCDCAAHTQLDTVAQAQTHLWGTVEECCVDLILQFSREPV
jgi:hypothetical protein